MADISTTPPLTRASVIEAHKIVQPHVHRTPILTNRTLTQLASTPRTPESLRGTEWEGRTPARPVLRLWFKCENQQRVGAFKVRGAFHALERLRNDPSWLDTTFESSTSAEQDGNGSKPKRCVVTHSSGNHAQALALAARESGIRAYIVMPDISSPAKVAATRGYGAEVIFSGSTAPEREAAAAKVMAETGARLVPPYDHPDIMIGQGTLGLEFQEQVAEASLESDGAAAAAAKVGGGKKGQKGLDAIMTPLGGGGMLSGVALSCEGTGIRVFGSEPSFQGADDGRRGFEAGERVTAVKTLTVADGLRTPVGEWPWKVIYEKRLVTGIYSVSETEIKQAMRLVFERLKVVVEPSGCVPLAVALFNEDFRSMVEREAGDKGWDLGLVFSGGNVGLDAVGNLFANPE